MVVPLARYDYASIHYQESSAIIENLVGIDIYEKVEDEVLCILDFTPRCSSIIENFNSRLAPYIPKNKTITQKRLDLLRFYLNHALFIRSYHKHLVGKSPAEALTGVKHDVWFKMLGFEAPQLIAA